jgi:hypothetical protein
MKARTAIATALSKAISSSKVRALNGWRINICRSFPAARGSKGGVSTSASGALQRSVYAQLTG